MYVFIKKKKKKTSLLFIPINSFGKFATHVEGATCWNPLITAEWHNENLHKDNTVSDSTSFIKVGTKEKTLWTLIRTNRSFGHFQHKTLLLPTVAAFEPVFPLDTERNFIL